MTKDKARLAVMGAISMALKDPTLQQGFEIICKNLSELEKENAELKGLVNQYKASKCSSISLVNRNMIMFDQLTKAKDHIKKLLDCLKQDTNDPQTNYYVCQYMDKAEQFLNEVEK